MECLKLHFKGAIEIIDSLLGIDFEQLVKADVRFDVDSHGIGENADRMLYDRAAIQRVTLMPLPIGRAISNQLRVVLSLKVLLYLSGAMKE